MENWIPRAVIYQVNLRSLAAREPRNAIEAACEEPETESPLAYVTRKLPVLGELGATVLYLMPPYPIGLAGGKGIGSPYAIRDFCDVHPEYGTMREMQRFVRRAHDAGFKVILDITPNHTSQDHVWTAGHREYYVKRDDGGLHYDCDWWDTAKLDYQCAGLRDAMTEVYDFWLSFLGPGTDGQPDGVDGFRLDMAHFINDRGYWNEAMPVLKQRHSGRQLLFLAESYGTENNMDLFARGINAAYDDDLYKVWLYLYAMDDSLGSLVRLSPHGEDHPDFGRTLDAFRTNGIAGAVESVLRRYEEALPSCTEGPWLARYTDNHDEGRGVYRFGENAVQAAMRLVFLSPRALPFILTGQEFGALNRPAIHERAWVCDKGRRIVRGQDVHEEAGIEFEGNVFARGSDRRQTWYAFYKELVRLRRETPELIEGAFAPVDLGEHCDPPDRTVVGFERALHDSTVCCAVNMGLEPRKLTRTDLLSGETLYGDISGDTLDAFSAIVVRR